MLVGTSRSVRGRVAAIIFKAAAVTTLVIAVVALGAIAALWPWPPPPSSPLGVFLGLVAAAIVFFEMALLPRKLLRGRRLGATRIWMLWHIRLGFACLPIVLLHAGFRFGGPLTSATLVLFLIVTFSGIWGLILQQWLPQKLLAEVPKETIASQIDFVSEYHASEAIRLVDELVTVPLEAESAEPAVVGVPAVELVAFRDRLLLPYLRGNDTERSPLASPAGAEMHFSQLRGVVPEVAGAVVERMRELAELRRQWDHQRRLQFLLHSWLVVHLPLSVAMTVLMLVHAVRALKYWS